MYLIKVGGTNTSISLSEQQLVSCVNGRKNGYMSKGCNGGYVDEALNYVAAFNQTRLSLWPYTVANNKRWRREAVCNRYNVATVGNQLKMEGKAPRFEVSNNEQERRRY